MRRITMRGNWSTELWILIAFVLVLLFVILPWFAAHSAEMHPAVPNASSYRK